MLAHCYVSQTQTASNSNTYTPSHIAAVYRNGVFFKKKNRAKRDKSKNSNKRNALRYMHNAHDV